ncbi:MAG: hypothetical protein M1430_07465, partial [Betaproteobacteria bacterium]|nr:hypothetical protein [Betaproteobacteria bacterium]
MAITTQERTNILKLTVGLFNAAPGANYLSEFTSVFEANGHNYGALALTLGTTGAFNSLYPNFQTASEFATKFLTTLGLQGNTEAVDFVTAKFNAGVPKAQIIYDAVVALDATTSATFANAKAILVNKAAVAENYSVTLGASSTSLDALQATLANVTADAASVTAANAANAGGNGQTFMLTAGVDTVAGTSGNDTINAQAVDATGAAKTTLSGFDAIDGGAGTDTLNIYTTGTENATFPTAATVKNVEIVNVYNTAAAAALGDASKFEGVTQLWQHGTNAADVSKLAATTTAGFKSVEATIAADLDVSAADAATTVTIALDGVKGDAQTTAT